MRDVASFRDVGPLGMPIFGGRLTSEDEEMLSDQIRQNKERTESYISLIDRLVNIERLPQRHARVNELRSRLKLLMEENNTFRRTLWHHWLDAAALDLTY